MTYDQFIAALCLWREARGSTVEAKNAIYHVLLNRATDPRNRWPQHVEDVVLQPKQFSSFNAGDPNSTKFPSRAQTQDWLAWLDCQAVVEKTLTSDPTFGATNYESCAPANLPSWAAPEKMTACIGPFRFYRL